MDNTLSLKYTHVNTPTFSTFHLICKPPRVSEIVIWLLYKFVKSINKIKIMDLKKVIILPPPFFLSLRTVVVLSLFSGNTFEYACFEHLHSKIIEVAETLQVYLNIIQGKLTILKYH